MKEVDSKVGSFEFEPVYLCFNFVYFIQEIDHKIENYKQRRIHIVFIFLLN